MDAASLTANMTVHPDDSDAEFDAALKAGATGTSAAPPGASSSADPEFDKSLAVASGKSPDGGFVSNATGLAANVGAGIWGSFADLAGLPGDIAGVPAIGSESIKRGMGAIGLGPKAVVATTPTQQAAQDIGAGIGSMVIPGLGAEAALGSAAAKELGPVTRGVLQSVRGGEGGTAATVAKNAGIGAASGAGSSAAQAAVPDDYKPLAGLAGSMLGGGLAAAGAAGFKSALARQPEFQANGVTYSGKTATAAAKAFTEAATDPEAAKAKLAEYTPSGTGFRPTTGQLTNDTGLLQQENWARTQNQAPFTARAQENNAALVNTTQAVQQTGDPAAVAETFRGQLAALDRAGQQVIDGAQQHFDTTMRGLGGHQFADTAGRSGAEQYGEAVRGYAQGGIDEKRQALNALWQTLREAAPDMRFSPQPVAAAVDTVTRPGSNYFNPEAGSQLTPEETRLYGLIRAWGDQPQPQENIATMRSKIGDEIANVSMPGASKDGQAARRLLEVRNALDESLGQAVTDRGAADQAAVAAGTLDPDKTFQSFLQRSVENWRARQAGEQQPAAGLDSGGQSGADSSTAQSASARGVNGATGEGGTQPSGASSSAGVAPPDRPLNPDTNAPYTAAELQQLYGTARAATRDLYALSESVGPAKQPAGIVTARGPYGGPNPVPDAAVAAQFWKAGNKGPAAWDNYVRTVGGNQRAIDTLADYAAHDLRRSAFRNGQFNEAVWRSWLKQHQDTLARNPQILERFSAPARAQEQIIEATRAHDQAMDAYQRSAARFHLANEDPAVALGKILRKDNPTKVADARQLARLAAADPTGAATQGLRRNVITWLASQAFPEGVKGVQAGDTGTNFSRSAAFRNAVQDNEPALRQILTHEQVGVLKRVATELQIADRAVSGSKAPAGPGTARDVAASKRYSTEKPSLLSMALRTAGDVGVVGLAAHFGETAGALVGKTGIEAVARFREALRSANLDSRNKLLEEVVLHPGVAHALMLHVTPTNLPSLTRTLLQSAARAGLFGLPQDERTKKAS